MEKERVPAKTERKWVLWLVGFLLKEWSNMLRRADKEGVGGTGKKEGAKSSGAFTGPVGLPSLCQVPALMKGVEMRSCH